MIYDRLSFMRRLEGEGLFSRPQAEALTDVLHEALSETVCTKADLSTAKSDLTREIAQARSEIGQVRSDLSQEIAQVRSDLLQVRSDLSHEISQLRSDTDHQLALLRSELKLWTGSMAAALFAALFTSLGGLMAIFKFLVH